MKRRCLVGIAGLMGLGVATFIRHPLTLFSNELNQPTINTLVSQTKGQGAYLNWSVPIPESNIFLSEDFESLGLDLSQNILTGTSVSYYGWKTDPYGVERPVDDPVRNSVKIIPGVGVNGSNGLLATQTTPGQGWNYTFRPNLPIPNGGSDVSSVNILGWKQLQAGEPAVVQFLAKGSGTLSIHLQSGWTGSSLPLGHEITWAESLSAEEFEARLKTNQPIKIHNPLEKTLNYTLHLATAFCEDYSYNFKLSLGVIEKQGEDWVYQPLEWHGAWKDKVRPGQLVTPDELRQVDSIQAGDFLYEIQSNKGASAKISIAAEEWTPYAMNIEIPSTQTALDLGSYYYLELASETTAQFQVDNLEFAYAPKSRLYRDGALILDTTRGVEFTDSEAKDLEAPKAVDESLIEISAEVLKDTANYQREVTFHWEAVEDLGTSYHYQVSSVDESGAEVAWSPEKSLEVVSGLKGYSVVIDHNPDTEPDNQVNTTKLSASYVANSGKPTYLHIKAIDEAGNVSETVHIKEVIAPEIRSEITDNKYLTTNWAVDLLDENVLWRFDYEEDEQSLIELVYDERNGAGDGGQYFDSSIYYNGRQSLYTPQTYPGKGNNFTIYNSSSDTNHIRYKKNIGLPNGTHIVASLRLKSDGPVSIGLFSDWKYANEFSYYNVFFTEDYPAGTKVLKVNTTNGLSAGNHLTVDIDPFIHQQNNVIDSIDYENNTITLTKATNQPVRAGDQLKHRPMIYMTNFPNINTSGTNGWELFNISTTVPDPIGINWEDNPVILRQWWRVDSPNGAWIDDLVVGYATKSRLYRDGVAVYEGYDAQFADTKAIDKVAPASVDLHQVETQITMKEAGTPTRQVNLNWENPLDRGTEYTYQVAMLDYQNQEVNHSKALVKEMVSGIKGYSVVLDTKPTTIPNTSIDTTEPTFTGELADSQTYYLHIRAIDYAGNASETTHIEIPYIEFEVEASADLENPNQYEQPGKILTWSSIPDYHYNVYRALKTENSEDLSFEKVVETTETSISGFSEDLTPPELPEIGRIAHQEEESVIHLKPISDQGNTYLYAIEGVHADGKQRFVSTPLEDGVVSGFAGYSYVIDQKSGTEPGDDINLTEATITHQPTNKKPYYLHIKAIDVAGNVSDTQHLEIESPTLELVATSNPDQNMIRLDWTNKPYHTYKVYQRREGASEFQSISLTNLEEGTQVKVLNLYPYSKTSSYPVTGEISFTTWKGESYTLPASASLKMWMETPTPDYPKGYGMGLIEVTPLDQTEFNRNPEAYLKNPDGTWKYDVIVNGFWDDNSGVDYTSESVELIRAFIESGKGYLFGHDTINGNPGSSGRKTNLLRDLVNVKFVTDFTPAGELFPMLFSSETQLLREGALLQYPHEIGEVGEILSIPRTHSTRQLAYGDVWMSLHGEGSTSGPDGLGTNNHYLTSWNNTALIQTGHSRGQATSDEQKILANTIFYLYQLSGLNYLNDYSGRDVAAPDTPLILSTDRSESGVMTIILDTFNDNGTTYEYYVQAFHEMDDSVLTSDVVSETITTGVAGISYVVDANAETIPDNIIEPLNGQLLLLPRSLQGQYLHVKVLDEAGNASETLHYYIEPEVFELTAEAKPEQNMIRLDWTDKPYYTYQVYQRKHDANEFQSIGTSNLTKTTKVLNIYPYYESSTSSHCTTDKMTSFTTWDGETLTLPTSAALKQWMEEPNSEHPRGYGQGLIEVDPISIHEFNSNPVSYLKDENNNWKYDVLMFGSWDSYGCGAITTESANEVQSFIDDGRGVLFGHDTVQWSDNPFSTQFLNDLDLTREGTMGMVGRHQIILQTNSIQTTYPWDLGGIGTVLNIPNTHGTGLYARHENVFAKFKIDVPGTTNSVTGNHVIETDERTNNWYLTQHNNVAVIQTGHSQGQATPDEQKILANTLFYLNQLSTDSYLNDYSGQDITAPSMPLLINEERDSVLNLVLTFDELIDNGDTYEYYVQATSRLGDSLLTSDIVSETITTGAAGFSYVIDSQAETIPDQTVDLLSGQSLVVSPEHQGKYLHIKSLDKAGNASETLHYKLPDPVILSLTVPSAPLSFVLNPNAEAGQIFQAPTFELVNDGNVSLAVELATFEQTSTVFNDVPPSKHSDWGILDQAASRDFALGLYPTRLTANGSENLTPIYVSGFQPLRLGELHPGERMNFEFQAHHGLSFKTLLTPSYRLTFIYEALTH